ncbi:hypothetical protein EBU99_09585 [bacterium]|nr:hypothetical protein [bacterium]
MIIFTRGGDAKLAYEVTLKGLLNDSIPIQRQIFVDAGNLAILENWELPYSPKNAGDRKFSGNIPFERVIAEKRADIAYATAHFRSTGESGGLNEASKEIFASLFEQDVSARKDSNKGSMSALAFGATGLSKEYRAMHNPALDGSSPNCYSSALNSLSTLQASGVARHFFYLLAEGSQPASPLPHSPTCNFSSLSGIGRNKAARIWYRAVTVYMTSTTNYLQAADATFKAATDIFGLSSTEANAVVATWAAVSVTTPTLVLAAAPTPGMPSQAIAASEGETPQEITTSTHSAETDCKKGARGTVSTNGYTKVSIGPYHGVNWLWSELEQRCIEGTPFSNGGSTRFFLELRSAYVVSTRVNGDCGLRQFVVRQVFADGHTEDTLLIDSEPGVKSFNPPAVILESQSTPSLPAGGCP